MGENKINNQSKKDDILKAYNDNEKEKEALKKENENISEQMQSMQDMMQQMQSQMLQIQESKSQDIVVKQEKIKPKSVKLMNLSFGMCHLVDSRFSVKFDKPFDKIPLRETVFEDFFYKFKKWFDEMDVIILDDDIAEEYGMKPYYDQYNISETAFHDAMGSTPDNMIIYVDSLPPRLRLTFVKEFAIQVKKGSEIVSDVNKHYALERYIKDNMGFEISIKEVVEQLRF